MLHTLTLTKALALLENKSISIDEVYADLFAQIEQTRDLNIYLTVDERALARARQSAHLPLKGLPIAVKDNYCTKDMRTTASSTVLDSFIPQYSATVIEKLEKAGGVIIGKTNMDAWAHGSSTETSQYGRTLNPRNNAHLPGGSSGGSAAAIAADATIAALGTETAGSIRQPAAWCGMVGLKPTYGRCSRYGIVSMASSTDSPGPMTKTVADAALLLNHIAGHDHKDATSIPTTTPDFTKALGQDIAGLRIGYLYEDLEGLEEATELFKPVIAAFSDLGATVESAHALDPRPSIAVYTIVQRAEVSSNLGRFDGIRYGNDRSFFGDEAKRRIMLGTYALSKGYADQYYTTAQKVRTRYIEDFQKLFTQFDVLISPTSPGFAKKIGATEGAAMFGELEDLLLEPSSLSGLPGISIPCHTDSKTNLSLGLNIMAPMQREDLVIKVADAFERHTTHNTWRKNS